MKNKQKYIDYIKTYYKEKRWQSRAIISTLILIFILGLARLLLPSTIIYSATSWLEKQGIESTIERIDIDIIDGTISLVNAKGHKNGEPLFNIGLIDIYWHWTPLSEKTIVVTKIGLDQLSVNIEQYTDEMVIGGLKIPLGKTPASDAEKTEAGTDEQVTSWAASLGEVIFTNLNICYLQHTLPHQQSNIDSLFIDYCVDLKKMSWSGTISYATDSKLLNPDDIPLSSTGDFSLDGLIVTDNKLGRNLLVSKSNALTGVTISGTHDVNIDRLDMNDLSLLQRNEKRHSDSIRFSELTIDDIKLSNQNSLTIKSISMRKPGVYFLKKNQTDWEYQEWLPRSSASAVDKAEVEKELGKQKPESSFEITLNNIKIDDADLCYQDNTPSLYYCLTFANFGWNGLIKYDTLPSDGNGLNLLVKGDLKLSQQNLHNQNIDRSLVGIDAITLSELKISGAEDISLKKFKVEKLTALQRGKNKNDATAAFDALDINDIKYTPNKIDINTIKLTGLSNTVSINKDGSWEHDKWLKHNKADKAATKTETRPEPTDKEPLVISLNSVNIISDKKLSFTDNSTQPAMKVGLQKFSFNINKLYSLKPKSNSPFNFSAKTFRHGTIDIKGTVKPFSDKLSLDANGDLKGFDLRVATPATKKAIGHIIKSGQLDAKLKLFAKEGVLDSNISLSLYQFHIESTSKEAADELDAKFGMPLNQTLVMLRDKDDSIHLDIPVTGDANNPEFDPMDAIIKATTKAATVTLITFYTPYGLLYAGGNVLFDLATALNFDPLEFDPGNAKLSGKNKEQLDKLAKLLTEKPQVHLTLCGATNQADLFKLFPDLKPETKDGKKVEEKGIVLSKTHKDKLKKLATERQQNSKNHLIDSAKITHDRLILCEPEIKAEKDALSGVQINI